MIVASRLCRYATCAGLLLAAALHVPATAQNPTAKVFSFGGRDTDTLAGFGVDSDGNYYVAGTTASLDLPANVLQTHPGGAYLYRYRAAGVEPLYPSRAPVAAIASDLSRPGVLYAAFDRAIWKSQDSGDTWQRLDADWPTVADCTQIVVAPKDGLTIYAVCPPSHSLDLGPAQLLRSNDAGATWERALLNEEFSPYSNLKSVAMDPFNPQSLWAVAFHLIALPTSGGAIGVEDGLYSADGGDTWTNANNGVRQIAFDERRQGIAYAMGNGNGLYRTTDSGQAWIRTALPPALTLQDFTTSSIAVIPTIAIHPSGHVLFAYGHLLSRSQDNGVTWETLPLPGEGMPCGALKPDPFFGSVYIPMCGPYLRTDIGAIAGNQQSAIFRSDDEGETWRRVNSYSVPGFAGQAFSATAIGSDYFALATKSSDAFVAKLSPGGDIIWSTYLGGANNDTATGLALDSNNNVYVIGTTVSDGFTYTAPPLAKALPTSPPGPSSFVAKLSPDGKQLQYSVLYAYDATARGIAADPSGAVYITGNAGLSLPTSLGVIDPKGAGSGTSPFVLKLDPSGTRVVYGTFLPKTVASDMPSVANAIAIDSEGNAYVGGSSIWKINPDASSVVFSTTLPGSTVNALVIDATRNIYVAGAANTLFFPATSGAFQTQLVPTRCDLHIKTTSGILPGCGATPAFVTKLNPDASQMFYSTYLGGDDVDIGISLAVNSDGIAYTTGNTGSRSFPTRLPIQGPPGPRSCQSAFASGLLPDGSDLLWSTYLDASLEPFVDLEPIAVQLDPAGYPVVAGYGFGAANPDADVLIIRLDYSGALNVRPRLDAILNAASRTGTPLAPGQRAALEGAGFAVNSQVCFNDACVQPITVADNEIVTEPPPSLPTHGMVAVLVRSSDGSRSNQVLMPVGPAEPAMYSANNSGAGQALALNEDGTLNSPLNPAHAGTVVTIAANGVRPSTSVSWLLGLMNTSVSIGTFPGIPGEIPLIIATVDPRYPAGSVPLTGGPAPGYRAVTLSTAR